MESTIAEIEVQRYEAYMNSGVSWVKEIPAHWELKKGKWLFQKQDRPVRASDDIVTCFRDGQVTLRINRKTEGFTNALKEHGYQGIRKGDLVIHAMDAFAGAIGVSDSDGKATPVYAACVPRISGSVNPYFFAYLLRNMAKTGFIESLAKGIRERSTDFRYSDFGELELTCPPLEEQTTIVDFLDRKTAQIDQAIAQKKRLIEQLQERRQILIQRGVTRGLNPDVPMKDSGMDWIGQIPAHWEVKKLKYVVKILKRIANATGIDVLSITQRGVKVKDINSGEGQIALDYSKYQLVFRGEFAMNHMDLLTGYVDISNFDGVVSPDYRVFTLTNSKFDKHYLLRLFQLCYKCRVFYAYGQGVSQLGRWRFPAENFNDFIIPQPPHGEQQEIADAIDKIELASDKSINQAELQIKKLREYKSILINAAVTGKIKVC
ncbi:type I restriction enzyme, S subunit [Hymenobacter daecheongensis DSM 21074]|uniref:Type I restriction enzyme, S subunit n=1 Tax=Hymenobacter daecheongensis DSM 21074 TaxID=1121955 RepID=A0A1M6EYA8_9BACT|nr:restriction endonuclease subunit S [Hymenobacter daecheongensis]SHI90400.1 type I restriction enzyme, S subunit [Hymenobacter daecheongensis DSM 21074]